MLVSVVIPTYNRARTIMPAVESAMGQTYRDLEIIIVDDGSTDDTMEVLKPLAGRIVLIRQDNAGPSAARNRGVVEAKGDIIAFLDSDDHWLPDKISRQVDLMRRGGPEMACCVCNALVKGIDGADLGTTFDFARLGFDFNEGEWTNPQDVLATRFLLFNQVVAVRREAFDRVGGFNENLRLLEDFELSMKLSGIGKWGVIREPLVVKFNDTNGIGVECMADKAKHAATSANVISGILGSGQALNPAARRHLEQSVADLEAEIRIMSLLKQGSFPARAYGQALQFQLRARGAMRRRSPAWPKFAGKALPA